MCYECVKARYDETGKLQEGLNPEPDQVALARYARLVERKELPRALPAWLRRHLTANTVKPIKYDYRQRCPDGSLWPWKEDASRFREAA